MTESSNLPQEALQDKLEAIHGICRVIFDYPELQQGLNRLMVDYLKEYYKTKESQWMD